MPPNGSRRRLSNKPEIDKKFFQGGGGEVEVLIQAVSESKSKKKFYFLLCLQNIALATVLMPRNSEEFGDPL